MPIRLVRFRSGQVRSNPLLQRKRRATALRSTPFPVVSLVQAPLPKLDELSGQPQRGDSALNETLDHLLSLLMMQSAWYGAALRGRGLKVLLCVPKTQIRT